MGNTFIVARFIEGVSINGYEYLLTDSGEVLKFSGITEAVDFLNKALGTAYKDDKEFEDNMGVYILSEDDVNDDHIGI